MEARANGGIVRKRTQYAAGEIRRACVASATTELE
jgi:hypothetical protein